MIEKDELRALVGPALEGSDLELVQVQVVPGHGQHQLRIFVDRPDGIDAATCARLSRAIARRLGERPDYARYRLEVSSPGMQRPIWTLEHYRRFAGERLVFELREEHAGRVSFRGRIVAVEGEQVDLETEEGETIRVAVDQIAQARLDLDPWKRPRASARGGGPAQ